MYDYDANIILNHPLKKTPRKRNSRREYLRLTKRGHTTKLFILDNECSNDLKLAILDTNFKFELVPPHQYRRNATERAIKTIKIFLAELTIFYPTFPITE